MPGLVWDSSELSLLDEPLDTVLSDDIWKKFDLDDPLDISHIHNCHSGSSGSGLGFGDRTLTAMTTIMNTNPYEDSTNSITLPEIYDKSTCHKSREIRHHDCMWAGLCISKEHNRTLPAKMDSQMHSRKVAAGRSLLISSRAGTQKSSTSLQQQQLHQHQLQSHPQRCKDSLESDGDSARPETPQSSESDSESESEDEEEEEEEEECIDTKTNVRDAVMTQRRKLPQQAPQQQYHSIKHEPVDGPLVFRHEQISINEKLTECMSGNTTRPKAAPVSEVTGQLVRKSRAQVRIKVKDEYQHQQINGMGSSKEHKSEIVAKKEPDSWHTLSDHCYHQPSSKNLEHLGVQTPSDSEEEIDVVTFEKPCRPPALPTYPSIADHQHFQLTVNSALNEKPAPRPRGRPPSSGTPRKRSAQPDSKQPAKRARQRTYQKRSKVTKNSPLPTPMVSPQKTAPSTSRSSSSSEDEPDTEKRSLHNNMERQRRIDLRNAFEDLRLLVPEIECKERAPKVAILRQAAIYCDMLTEIGQVTEQRVNEMKQQQERLRARLSQLRRNLAMTR